MPPLAGHLGQVESSLPVGLVEQTELDPLGHTGYLPAAGVRQTGTCVWAQAVWLARSDALSATGKAT